MLPLMSDWAQRPEILHQAGDEDFLQVRQAYRNAGYDPGQVVSFIDDMANAYTEASLVICRAGATTLAELTVCGRPAILIPFPSAAGDHQTANAKALENVGAAIILPQNELTPEKLAALVKEFLKDRQKLQDMAEQGRRLGYPEATERILDECRRLIGMSSLEAG
jgi:UDP-N-acetylglucosamine--N-acetylmuramyl-(pentapeptide) pyrophosphoryl-undecaprenol N-acetylglucosamine transferase